MFVQIEDDFVNADHILRFKSMGRSIVFYLINGKTISWDFLRKEQLDKALENVTTVLKVQKLY